MAVKYAEKSCTLNYSEGCNVVGLEYESGNNVLKNIKKAKEYYKKACNLGYSEGCKNYARITN